MHSLPRRHPHAIRLSHNRNVFLNFEHHKHNSKTSWRSSVGGITGTVASIVYINTGAEPALHEIVGHGVLGFQLTANFPDGEGPTYRIFGFEEFNNISKLDSIVDKGKALFTWLFLPKDGVQGWTLPGYHGPNNLAKYMGTHRTSAWVSIAGSVPGLAVNALCSISGMALKDKYPIVGWGLLWFGLSNNTMESTYAWSAALMSSAVRNDAAKNGHDFANFACRVGIITGIDSSVIAISTALFWTCFVPIIAICIYLHQRSHRIDIIPTELALKHWLSQLCNDAQKQKLFKDLLINYSKKSSLPFVIEDGALAPCIPQNMAAEEQQEAVREFLTYLEKKLPSAMLIRAKQELLQEWQVLQKPSKFEKSATYVAVATSLVSTAAQICKILSETIVPTLASFTTILKVISPFLGLLSIAQSGYRTYKDLRCSNSQVPLIAKILSCLNLATTIISTAVMLVATFVPGMQFLLIPTILIRALLTTIFDFSKIKLIQKQFKEHTNINGQASGGGDAPDDDVDITPLVEDEPTSNQPPNISRLFHPTRPRRHSESDILQDPLLRSRLAFI